MSGLVSTGQGQVSWSVASWAYDHVMRLATRYILECEKGLLILMDPETNPLRRLFLDGLKPAQREIFRHAIESAYEDARVAGPESFAERSITGLICPLPWDPQFDPEFYAGFMDRCAELLQLLREGTIGEGNRMPQLSEKQIRLFGSLLQRVFVDIRGLGAWGKAQQAADLADAFHNLPTFMFSDSFSWSMLRHFVTEYQRMYPPPNQPCDYLRILDAIERGDDDVQVW